MEDKQLITRRCRSYLAARLKRKCGESYVLLNVCRVNQPFTAWGSDPVEPVPEMMLVSMVTCCAEVIIGALCTFPANTNNGLLTAGVTHGSIMLDA